MFRVCAAANTPNASPDEAWITSNIFRGYNTIRYHTHRIWRLGTRNWQNAGKSNASAPARGPSVVARHLSLAYTHHTLSKGIARCRLCIRGFN